MSAALAQNMPQPVMPPDMLAVPTDDAAAPPPATTEMAIPAATATDPFLEEIRIGFEQLRAMNHNELRAVISRRVEMLETVLREREQRRAAIETARLASRMLDLRRQRALRIRKRVNFGSALAALASTFLIVAVMV